MKAEAKETKVAAKKEKPKVNGRAADDLLDSLLEDDPEEEQQQQ